MKVINYHSTIGSQRNIENVVPKFTREPIETPKRPESNKKAITKILFLSADPMYMPRLRLFQELNQIKTELRLSGSSKLFDLQTEESLKSADLSRALLYHKPQVVHFSGHGNEKGELCLENEFGRMSTVTVDALVAAFDLVEDQVECVILNSCYSVSQASAIASQIKYVIGMNNQITDDAAIVFTSGFYKALAVGENFERAFRTGLADLKLRKFEQHTTPTLIANG